MTDPRMTPTNDAPVTVEQCDREAGLALRLYTTSIKPGDYRYDRICNAFRSGEWDDKESVQSFARHRLAALASAPAESETVSLYREIDALGETGDGEWHRGYSEALTDVLVILSRRGFSETEVSVSSSPAIPAGMVAWHGGNGAPADWDGGPVHYANGITARPLDDGDWQRPADVPLIGYTPRLASAPAGDGVAVAVIRRHAAEARQAAETDADHPQRAEQHRIFAQALDELAREIAALARPPAAVGEREKPKSEPEAWGDRECSGCTLPRRDCECN